MLFDATLDSPYFFLSEEEKKALPNTEQMIVWNVPYSVCDIFFPCTDYLGDHEVLYQVLCSDGISYFIKLNDQKKINQFKYMD